MQMVTSKYIISKDPKKIPIKRPGFERIGTIERLDLAPGRWLRHGILAKEIKTGLYVQFKERHTCTFRLDQRAIKPLLGIKNGAGRPKTVPMGAPHQLYIAHSDYVQLKEIGSGNASEGVRKLLAGEKS